MPWHDWAQSVGILLRSEPLDQYGLRYKSKEKNASLVASEIDEPKHCRVVPMLLALPPDEAAFYEFESNVVEPLGKTQHSFDETGERFGFVLGITIEYVFFNESA